MKRLGLAAAALAMLAAAGGAQAADKPKHEAPAQAGAKQAPLSPADQRAQFLSFFFIKTCLANMGHPEILEQMVAPGQQFALPPASPEVAKAFLGGQPGKAWVGPPPAGETLLVQWDSGLCTVFIRDLDPALFERNLKDFFHNQGWFKLVETLRKPGELTEIRYDLVPQGEYRAQLKEKVTNGQEPETKLELLMTTSPKKDGPFQIGLAPGLKGAPR